MSTLSSANVTDVNLVLKERTHKIKIKYSMHQYSNSNAYFRQLAHYLLFVLSVGLLLFHAPYLIFQICAVYSVSLNVCSQSQW